MINYAKRKWIVSLISTAYRVYDNWDAWAPCMLYDVTNTVLTIWMLYNFFRKDLLNMINRNIARNLMEAYSEKENVQKMICKNLSGQNHKDYMFSTKRRKGWVNSNDSQRTLIVVSKCRLEPQIIRIQEMFFPLETNKIVSWTKTIICFHVHIKVQTDFAYWNIIDHLQVTPDINNIVRRIHHF